MDWGEAWALHNESMAAYGEQRYADALGAVRRALEQFPDHAGLNYNYACFGTLAGEIDDDTFAHLRRGVEGFPPFRGQARVDEDLAAVHDDPRSRRLFFFFFFFFRASASAVARHAGRRRAVSQLARARPRQPNGGAKRPLARARVAPKHSA